MAYFIIKNGKKEGPLEISDLKGMKLLNDTLVWKEGFENWKPAKEVEELIEITFTPPPPIPAKKITTEEIFKIIFIHLFFGFGFYYVDKTVQRKFIYPIAGFYALLDILLANANVKPFETDEFGLTTFIISLVICYLIGYIDVFRHLYKITPREVN